MKKHAFRKLSVLACVAAALLFVSSILVPQLLQWPYKPEYGSSTVYAEQPIGPQMKGIMAKADALTRASAIYDPDGYSTDIFLSNGGWRWKWLSLGMSGSFAISRQTNNAIVINRSDIARNKVWNGQAIAGERSLSSIIAHERTHGLIQHRYGRFKLLTLPTPKVEGYCDYIAQESSLTLEQYEGLMGRGDMHPAMPYFEGRQSAIYALETERLTVDEFFGL